MSIKPARISVIFLILPFLILKIEVEGYGVPIVPPPILAVDTSIQLAEPVTNCGVEVFTKNDSSYVYVFGGMDSTLKYSGIHRRCYRINLKSGAILRLPDLPDTLGKIALSATRIKDKIYVVGGYHVFADGSEVSSSLVHEFDPIGDTFTTKKIILPTPIDDHVQLSYKDSLLYIVGGWSNTKNVNNVQIYDPNNDVWLAGTPLPDSRYLVFGASGYLSLDYSLKSTIKFFGGASNGSNFPASSYLASGIIDKMDATKIQWSVKKQCDSCLAYRSACVPIFYDRAVWLGGSDSTYNYDAVTYAGKKVVSPSLRNYRYYRSQFDSLSRYQELGSWNPHDFFHYQGNVSKFPLDIRDIGQQKVKSDYASHRRLTAIVGGIYDNQKVGDRVFLLTNDMWVGVEELDEKLPISVYPNPANTVINIENKSNKSVEIEIYDMKGVLVITRKLTVKVEEVSISELAPGPYFIYRKGSDELVKFIKQ